jgi:iron-sulfur cluster assembly protein
MTGPITRQTNIQKLAMQWPEAAAVMAEKGMHCFGCHAAAVDNVEHGAKLHGLDDATIDQMVKDMNEIIALKGDQPKAETPKIENPKFTITESAAKKLKELMAEEDKEGHGLRVAVMPGGCSGFSYGLDFEDEAKENDLVMEEHGIKLYIDKESLSMVNGAEVDYVDGLMEAGFKISNPNAQQNCGCGKSFS